MRKRGLETSRIRAVLAAGLGLALAGAAESRGVDPADDSADPAARLAALDAELAAGRPARVLECIRAFDPARRNAAEVQWRAAQAWFALDVLLGEAAVRTVAQGRPGQFAGEWLVLEARPGRDRFLCCPPDCALYQLRRALDAGLDLPAAHVLHARIWQRLDRPEIGLKILRNRKAVLLESADEALYETYSALALAADERAEFLEIMRRWAAACPERRNALLFRAYTALAERYARAGDATLHREWLRRAARLAPENVDVLVRLGDSEWDLGRRAEAGRCYRRALQLDVRHAQRERMLERLLAAESPAESTPP